MSSSLPLKKMSISMIASSWAECRAFRQDKQYKSRLGTILLQADPLALHSRGKLISATHKLVLGPNEKLDQAGSVDHCSWDMYI